MSRLTAGKKASQRLRTSRFTCAASADNPDTSDTMIKTIAVNGECIVTVAQTTNLVTDCITRHKTLPTASAALGRGITGCLLLSTFRAEGEQVQLIFKGSGPLGTMTCIGNHEGHVRGMVNNPNVQLPMREDGKFDVGSAVGPGVLSVVRSTDKILQPFTGTVELVSGEIAEDIAVYLRDSEQSHTAIGLGVAIETDGTCKGAGGFLVQVLPLVSDETLGHLERNLAALPPTTELLSSGVTPMEITARILEGIGCSPGEQQLTPMYGPCDQDILRPRMLRAVSAIPPAEIEETIQDVGCIEVNCEFCQEKIQFSRDDLKQLLI